MSQLPSQPDRGLGLWIDIHVEVQGDMTVHDGHEIAHRMKDALKKSKHNVMDVVVHIEPMDNRRLDANLGRK